ncbi:hypothetical protein [Marichromatium purpuratum]|uniref:hypothetical protein n=1 Tax=Marichromatium purpuratum TaxID=37487 RepID=UPI00021E7364|nr:hypothetical protein [Marichromatium purpuratum]
MKLTRFFGVSISVFFIVSCVSGMDRRDFDRLEVKEADKRLGNFLVLKPCSCERLLQDESSCDSPSQETKAYGTIASAVFSAAAYYGAKVAVNLIDENIEAYKNGLSGSFSAITYFDGDFVDNEKGCLIVARGLIGSMGDDSVTGSPEGCKDVSDVVAAFSGGRSRFVGCPAFYLEEDVVVKKDAFIFKPRRLIYGASVGRNPGSGMKNVSLMLTMGYQAVGSNSGSGGSEGSALMLYQDFGRLDIGRSYDASLLAGTDMMVLKSVFSGPKVVTAVVTDSEEPGVGLKAIEAALDEDSQNAFVGAFEVWLRNVLGVKDPEEPESE